MSRYKSQHQETHERWARKWEVLEKGRCFKFSSILNKEIIFKNMERELLYFRSKRIKHSEKNVLDFLSNKYYSIMKYGGRCVSLTVKQLHWLERIINTEIELRAFEIDVECYCPVEYSRYSVEGVSACVQLIELIDKTIRYEISEDRQLESINALIKFLRDEAVKHHQVRV